MRLDHLQRPELNKGTVDFLVPDEYWAIEPPQNLYPSYASVGPSERKERRPPQPMNYVFAFDISADAVRSGFLRSSCDALRTILYRETDEGPVCKLPAGTQITIISYDCAINVYRLVGDTFVYDTYTTTNHCRRVDQVPRMYSLCQISKMYSCRWVHKPLLIQSRLGGVTGRVRENLLTGLYRTTIQDTLTAIPDRAYDTTVRESVLGSAICVALAALVCGVFLASDL